MKNMGQPKMFEIQSQQLFECGSDNNASCTPRFKATFSSNISNLTHGEYLTQLGGQQKKQQDLHKYLHEKSSVIDSNPSEHSESSYNGDSLKISQKSETISGLQGNYHVKSSRSESSLATSSFDSDLKYTTSRCKNYEFRRKNNNASNDIGAEERRSAGSRLSSQRSYCPRGISLSVFGNKFKIVVTKSLRHIANIREIMTKGIEPPDGKEDESRRVMRVKEFTNRFSRNYLYPLARQLKDLSAIDQINPMLVNHKLLSTYQIIHNALQAYQTYLPSSVGDAPYIQLKTLMENIIGVCGFHRNLNDTEDNYILEFIDSFKINAELTVQKVEEFVAKSEKKKDGGLKIEKSKINLTKYGEEKAKNTSKKSKQDRLAMYSRAVSFRQDVPWRRAVQTLAKKKFNVKSKYRTATYKHRPPVQKDVELMSIPKLKALMHGKQQGILKSCRFNLPVNEDCIKTMVESEEGHLEKEKRTEDEGREIGSTKEVALVELFQFILKHRTNKTPPESETDAPMSEILHLVKSEESDGLLKKLLNSLLEENSGRTEGRENDENAQRLTSNVVKSNCSLSDGALDGNSKRKEPKVTVTGTKNARLICIIDDNSLIEPSGADGKDSELAAVGIVKTSSEAQTDITETSKATQKGKHAPNVKISRVRKTEKPLKSLDRRVAVNAVQYKLDFYRFCRNNPMYKRSTSCQPWVLMGKLSEDLLNHCFLSVAREIEINEIVDKAFQSELQL
ncbi:uncharacterized protein [Euwallacea fornicatus]|uniref:uncharacterized protein isoform X2 n=1 Tax=Euwallacea fornicatus TaxID=995702 RepID=UPI00338F21B4